MPIDRNVSLPGGPLEEYLAVAEGTGAFRPSEIDVLKEVISDTFADPSRGYLFLEERLTGGKLAGFAVFGRVPMTDWAWDLYWIVVDRSLQGKGIGRRMLEKLETTAMAVTGRVILRVETSGRNEYVKQRQFYLAAGFRETGRIRDFYEEGDDLVTYCKFIPGEKFLR
jgi:ribosomal protein S18 acetylase RimI-like enzyme